ncbi:hypothetical protein FRB94_000317 [Tulasnella sp. JGI-2019a]|nr:hypothetical protein FRB94_000317 [Tulasnella sp. JGI-2019a]KAG9023297.1 hypothetical protein FRB95_013277 [Tulasnella sp. JGI-2019a]
MSGLARIYQAQFDRAPTRTLMATNGFLNAVGDFSAQGVQLFSTRDFQWRHYDPLRTLRFVVFGATLGPIIGRWNKFLEHNFPLRSAVGTVSLRSLAKRVGADQIVMAPIGLTYFITSMGFMEGRSAKSVGIKYQDMFIPAMLANWKVWPAAQLVNFRFMPLP